MRNKKLIALLSIVGVLVVLIIVCGATFLVREVSSYGYYENSGEYDEAVVTAAGIKKNSSILFLDEAKVKDRVEAAYPNIVVQNVERRFPDKVVINYVAYENLYSYYSDGKYYNCYASGRIGSITDTPISGSLLLKPRSDTAKTVGAYFESSGSYDIKLINTMREYWRTTGLSDKQIAERIAFVDLTREDYVYIRTTAGCSIEIHGVGASFENNLDICWSAFNDATITVNKTTGTIRPRSNGKEVVYTPTDGDEYYKTNYVK